MRRNDAGRFSTLTVAALAATVFSAPSIHAQEVHVHGIDSLHVRSNIQGQFNTTSVDDEPDSAWAVRRARIMIRMFAAGWIRADVEGDFGRGRPRLTDGFVRLDFDPALRIRAGQYKKPFDALELVSSRELLVIERDGLPRGADLPTPNGLVKGLGYSDRDIGAEWSGSFEVVTLTAGFWNGSGTDAEEDDGKQLGLRAEVEGPAGWTLSGALAAIRISPPEDSDEEGEWQNAVELAASYGEYAEPGFKALGQLFVGDGEPDEEDEPTFTALHAIVAYHIATWETAYLIGIEPMGRFGWTDPDTDFDDDEATLWTAGVNLYHHARVKTQVQVDHVSPAEGGGETAARLQLALGF